MWQLVRPLCGSRFVRCAAAGSPVVRQPVCTRIPINKETIGRYAKRVKQAVCKTVAFGPCRFKSYSADFMPQNLNWKRSCPESSWSVKSRLAGSIPVCGAHYVSVAEWNMRRAEYPGRSENHVGSSPIRDTYAGLVLSVDFWTVYLAQPIRPTQPSFLSVDLLGSLLGSTNKIDTGLVFIGWFVGQLAWLNR